MLDDDNKKLDEEDMIILETLTKALHNSDQMLEKRRLFSVYRMKTLLKLNMDPSDAALEAIRDGDMLTMMMLISLLDCGKHNHARNRLLRMCLVTALESPQDFKIHGMTAALLLLRDFIEMADHESIANLIPDVITLAQNVQDDPVSSEHLIVIILCDLWNAASKLSFWDAFEHRSKKIKEWISPLLDFIPNYKQMFIWASPEEDESEQQG